MSSEDIRKKFLGFFERNGHKVVPSSSLIPDDPSVLLTTAGMQQFKKYYTGEADAMADFGSKNMASVQKSFRTSDIDEVGDESHNTFFEMLGNFSFGYKPGEPVSPKGGYFKKEAIEYAHKFINEEMGLEIDYVSVFEGDGAVPADAESEDVWKSLGVKNIKKFGKADNFWGPTGAEGPCGPTTEIYINGVEIWNIVFNEYYCKNGKLEKLKTPGVDTGMGLERLAMVSQEVKNIFETDLFAPLVSYLSTELPEKIKRVMADHARGVTFLLADGVRPSNKEAGYVLRRLMRRVFVYEHLHNLRPDTLEELMKLVIENYGNFYPELQKNKDDIINAMWAEHEKFGKTLKNGLKKIGEMIRQKEADPKTLIAGEPTGTNDDFINRLSGKDVFDLYQSDGFPPEVTREVLANQGYAYNEEEFQNELKEEFKKHQEKSRAGAEKKFGGHGLILDTGELKAGSEEELKKVTRLHTATHLMQQALRDVLGQEVHQAGSDITAERTRFDFTFGRKVTKEELKKVEDAVNEVIKKDLPMQYKEMPIEEAKKTGALYYFKEKYPDMVRVYYVGNSISDAYSKEFCGGPHVMHTGEIGTFKIVKEEASSAGVRRIRATVD